LVALNSFYSIVVSLLSYLLFGVAGETVILISSTNCHSKRVNVTWFLFLPQKSPFSTLRALLILMSLHFILLICWLCFDFSIIVGLNLVI
jgi:hypothetical protein